MRLLLTSHLSKIDFTKTSDSGSIELLKKYKPELEESINKFSSIFGQILQIFSKKEFYKAVIETRAERWAKGFTCWQQFVAMLFCQIGQAHSLIYVIRESVNDFTTSFVLSVEALSNIITS